MLMKHWKLNTYLFSPCNASEIMEEEMICGLQRLGSKKVDVSFQTSSVHCDNIHVKVEWFHKAGAGVVAHVADSIKQQEKQHQSSSFAISLEHYIYTYIHTS